MKTTLTLLAILALAITVSAAPAARAEGGCCSKCTKATELTVKGKLETKTETVDGKEQKSTHITVAEATTKDGKSACELKGKTLKLTGAKSADTAGMCGKDVELKGTASGTELEVAQICK